MAYRLRAKVGDRIYDPITGHTGKVEHIDLPRSDSAVQMPAYLIRKDDGHSLTIVDPNPDFEILSDEAPRRRAPVISQEDAQLLRDLERSGMKAEAAEFRRALGLL